MHPLPQSNLGARVGTSSADGSQPINCADGHRSCRARRATRWPHRLSSHSNCLLPASPARSDAYPLAMLSASPPSHFHRGRTVLEGHRGERTRARRRNPRTCAFVVAGASPGGLDTRKSLQSLLADFRQESILVTLFAYGATIGPVLRLGTRAAHQRSCGSTLTRRRRHIPRTNTCTIRP